ncbi:MAG: hypothetical protein WDM81_00580 [Rhizomicrobium sp.]
MMVQADTALLEALAFMLRRWSADAEAGAATDAVEEPLDVHDGFQAQERQKRAIEPPRPREIAGGDEGVRDAVDLHPRFLQPSSQVQTFGLPGTSDENQTAHIRRPQGCRQARALRALKKARKAAETAGVTLSDWEGEFLGSVETRVEKYGRAFRDPEKAAPVRHFRCAKPLSSRKSREKPRARRLGNGVSGAAVTLLQKCHSHRAFMTSPVAMQQDIGA